MEAVYGLPDSLAADHVITVQLPLRIVGRIPERVLGH